MISYIQAALIFNSLETVFHPLSQGTADTVDMADSMVDNMVDMDMCYRVDMGMGMGMDSTVGSPHRITMELLPTAINC